METNILSSTANLVASLLLARNREVLERATDTITPLLVAERPGSDTIHSACGDTDKRNDLVSHRKAHDEFYTEVSGTKRASCWSVVVRAVLQVLLDAFLHFAVTASLWRKAFRIPASI